MLKKFPCMDILRDPAKITVVSGLPRSGTSMLMRILAMGGIDILSDNIRAKDDRNPHGYYEFEPVKDKHTYQHWIESADGKTVKVVSRFLPYLPATRKYYVIFARRNIDSIIRSQKDMAMHYSSSQWIHDSEEKLKDIYTSHLQSSLDWINARPNIEVLLVDYEKIVQDPRSNISQIINFLPHENLDYQRMVDAVDSSLHHN